jgi:hypothetical protein
VYVQHESETLVDPVLTIATEFTGALLTCLISLGSEMLLWGGVGSSAAAHA